MAMRFKKQVGDISFKICEKEYDSPELNEVIHWLKDNGWSLKEIGWELGGSQELTTYEISKGSLKAKLLLETYMGVTLIVSPDIKEQFEELTKEKMI